MTDNALRREPLVVVRAEWISAKVRSRIPPAPPHDEWRLEIELECATAPVRAAAVLWSPFEGQFTRGWADVRGHRIRVDVRFFPTSWEGSDDVQVNLLGRRFTAASPALKLDPRAATTGLVRVGDTFSTGVPVRLLAVPSVGVAAEVFAVVAGDTRKRRGRWWVTRPVADLGSYSFLLRGQVSGLVDQSERVAGG